MPKNRVPRARRLWLTEVQAIHKAQRGRCAVPSCFAHVPMLGRGRALDPTTKQLLCKACSIVLGIVDRDRRRLQGLISYLDRTTTK